MNNSGRNSVSCLLIALFVFLSRYFTRGGLYFVDGPRLVRAIEAHVYVIQPPGYWLYCRLGSIFPDPTFGLTLINELFSAAGAAVFFLLCRRLRCDLAISIIAALAYSSIFYLWFAGDVQSSYASQILFAPLTVYCFLLYDESKSAWALIACAASFAVGAGLRPSDGAFLAPLFIFMLFRFVRPWKRRGLLALFTFLFCMGWYIPTQIALHAVQGVQLRGQLGSLASQVSPLLIGINERSVANVLRVVLPFVAAFWMLIPSIALGGRPRPISWICFLWVVPGVVFFLLVYMADATYLTFLTGGIILLAATVASRRFALISLSLCLVFNVALFLGARPLQGNSRADLAINFYVVKYCHYGIRHQWSGTIGHPNGVLKVRGRAPGAGNAGL